MDALLGNPFKGISILDCPEANQTSPIMTSSIDSAFEAFTSTLKGPPAARAGRYELHLPSLSEVASALCPSRVTVTFSSGSAQPQKCIGAFLCSTKWLLRIFGRRTSAQAEAQVDNAAASKHTII